MAAMKVRDPKLRLRWSGEGPLDPAVEMLDRYGCVEIELPAEFHHAIFSHFHPHAWETQAEQLDEEGGIELLRRIAEVDQLAAVEILIDALAGRSPKVSVRSPAPHITIFI